MLAKYKLPTLSTAATSPDLSNKANHKYFSRVCMSDAAGVDALVAFLKHVDVERVAMLNSG